MKTAIVYYSKHHGNTKKLIDAIAKENDIVCINVSETPDADLTDYDLIGFASGIYYSKFHKSVLNFTKRCLPEQKNVFFLYTYGAEKEGYTKAIQEIATEKNAHIAGEYGCFGFNTFGPFKLIGGMAKGHPSDEETDQAVRFYRNLIQ